MALNPTQREDVFIEVEDDYTRDRTPTGLSRQDLRGAVNAIDDWVDANLASFVAALPVAVRNATNAKQKVAMLKWVLDKRWEVE